MTRTRFLLHIFLVTLLISIGCQSAPRPSSGDIEIIRSRYRQLIAPEDLDLQHPAVHELIRKQNQTVQTLLESQIMNPEGDRFGSWSGLKTTESGAYGGPLNGAVYGPTSKLARAFATRGSRYHGDEQLIKRITQALKFGDRYLAPEASRHGNWWVWDVALPRNLADTLLLVGDQLPRDVRRTAERRLRSLVRTSYPKNFRGGAANLLWVAYNQLRTSLVTGNRRYLRNASDNIARVARSSGPFGIQFDFSYHYHGHGLNMGYGRSHARNVSRFLYLTDGTAYALPDAARRYHEKWFRNFIINNSYRGRSSPFSIGREIARDGGTLARRELQTAIYLYLAGSSDIRDVALSLIAEWYDALPKSSFLTLGIAALASRFEPALPKADPVPQGVRYYPYSDYLTARQPGFYAAIRMSSNRVKSWFSIRNENVRGHHSGDGTLVLMTDGREWSNDSVPTRDWNELSGITAAPGYKNEAESKGHSRVVGGFRHGKDLGLAAMDFRVHKNENQVLAAHKSYVVSKKGVFLLGDRIRLENDRLPESKEVYTSLHQVPLRKHDRTLVVDGEQREIREGQTTLYVKRWLHIRNYGYLFPEPTDVSLSVQTRTRSFYHLNRRYDPDNSKQYTRRFYALKIRHGRAPKNGSYRVFISPDARRRNMPAIARNPDLRVQTTGPNGHVIRQPDTNTKLVSLFGREAVAGYEAERPVLLAVTPNSSRLSVSLQDPAFRGNRIEVKVPFQVKDPPDDVRARRVEDGTILDVKLSGGEPRHFTIPRAGD